MKTKYFQRLGIRVSLTISLILFVILSGAGVWLYFAVAERLIMDRVAVRLSALSAEKRQTLEQAIENIVKGLNTLATNEELRAAASRMRHGKSAGSPEELKKFLETESRKFQARSLSLLDLEGKVAYSVADKAVGMSFAGKSFMKDPPGSASVRGFLNEGGEAGVVFIAPVADSSGYRSAYLYCLLNKTDLAAKLQNSMPSFKTELIDLTDGSGVTVFSGGTVVPKGKKYAPAELKKGAVQLKDDRYVSLTPVSDGAFFLAGSVSKEAVSGCMQMFLLSYGIAVLIVGSLVFLVCAAMLNKMFTVPFNRFINSARLIGTGDMNINLEHAYAGEFLEMKEAFQSLMTGIKNREAGFRQSGISKEKRKIKSVFLVRLAQETRRSLSSIINEIGMLLERLHGFENIGKGLIDRTLAEAEALMRLMDDMTDTTKLEEGELSLEHEEFLLCEFLKDVENIVTDLKRGQSVELIIDCSEDGTGRTVCTDRQRLRQIVANLLTNALLTTESGTVTVVASIVSKDGTDFTEISVSDTGEGFAQEQVEAVFDEFSASGSYLGLAIAKKLSLLLGGRVEVDNTPGKGTVFTAVIPNKTRSY